MRKNLFIVGLVVVLLSMTVIPAIALDGDEEGPEVPKAPPRTRPHGESNVGHLLLVGKDADTPGWDANWPGPFGLLKYNLEGETFDYRFNGHGLIPDTTYALIYYANLEPLDTEWAYSTICLATGVPNNGGNLHINDANEIPTGLPIDEDKNTYDDDTDTFGAKIWLVTTDDYNCETGRFEPWNPTEYLFEYDLITYGYRPPNIDD